MNHVDTIYHDNVNQHFSYSPKNGVSEWACVRTSKAHAAFVEMNVLSDVNA